MCSGHFVVVRIGLVLRIFEGRGWCIIFATGLNTKIDIVQKVF